MPTIIGAIKKRDFGYVVDTVDLPHADRVRVQVVRSPDKDAFLYVERTNEARSISPGDTLRWQGTTVFWTPKGAPFTDKPLARVFPND